MDIRLEPMANLPHRGPEKTDGVKEKHNRGEKPSTRKKEGDQAVLEAVKMENLKDRMISKEELQDFMLLLMTSRLSPKMFNRFVDEKRKSRISELLNTRA